MTSNTTGLWVLLGLTLAGIMLMTKRFKRAIKEDFGAFIHKFELLPPSPPSPPKAPHPLCGLSFAVSDIFDIEGYITGFGNPQWSNTHEAASSTSSIVSSLIEKGATCTGKTIIDELAQSITGDKNGEGPVNPAYSNRLPGGSSSGAAVAVAAGLVDFALGVDSVGDVRVPAAFCGILGFRASLGAITHVGVLPISQSLDTVGVFAKDPKVLHRVGHALLRLPSVGESRPRKVIIADDYFRLVKFPKERALQVVTKSTEKIFGRNVLKHYVLEDFLRANIPSLKEPRYKKRNGECEVSSVRLLADIMQRVHRYEFKVNHGEWIQMQRNSTAIPIEKAQEISDDDISFCKSIRNEVRSAFNSLLMDDGILVIPTMAYLPPKLGSKEALSDDFRISSYSLLSGASLSGCCQVAVPIGYYDQCPVSVSLIGRHGSDRFLLEIVQKLYPTLQEQADELSKASSQRGLENVKTPAEIAKEKGNQAFKNKQWKKAINHYTEAIELDGENATYYSNRAASYLEATRYIDAEADCTEAIKLDKKNVKAYLRRGTAKEMLGNYQGAIRDFEDALVLEPKNKLALLCKERLRSFGS